MNSCILALAALPAFAAHHAPLYFEKNLGQADARVRFLARTRQATVFLTDTETVYSLRGSGRSEAAVRMTLPGSRRTGWIPTDAQPVSVSSYVGPRGSWRQDIPTFAKVTQAGVFPGVDLVYYGNAREMEYDFVLRPGADPRKIRLRFTGVKKSRVSATGDLELETGAGTLVHRKPRVFQDRDEIAGRYRLLSGGDVGIELTGRFDPSRPLRIDPIVTFASFYGGEADDVITSVSGQAVAGYTNSIAFPGTRVSAMGGYDAFFMAFGASTRIVYIGGSRDDKAWAVFHQENDQTVFQQRQVLAIAGETASSDFPVFVQSGGPVASGNGGLPAFAGGQTDGFLVISAPDSREGLTIQSMLIGGSGDDRILGLAADGSNVYGVGETDSRDLQAVGRQQQLNGGKDGFLFSRQIQPFSSGGATVTYWGGSGDDSLRSISLSSGLFAVAGTTTSDDIPLARPIQESRNGGPDGYAAILPGLFSPTPIVFGSYWGGSGDDTVNAVAWRADRSLWIFGDTASPNLRMEQPAQAAYGGGASDAYIAQIRVPADPDQPAVLARSSYLGGAGTDTLTGMTVAADFYLAGTTGSRDFPQRDPLQPGYGGGDSDAWLAQLSPGGEILFSSYYGGSGADEGRGIGLDRAGGLLLAGVSASGAIPGGESEGAYGPGGVRDGYAVQVTTPVLSLTAPTLGAKDAMAVARLAPTKLPVAEVMLRARSSDPSRLTVSFGQTTEGTAEASTQWNGEGRAVYLHGLASEGTAEVTVSAEGLGERSFMIALRPLALSVGVANPIYRASVLTPFNRISPLKTGQTVNAFVTVGFVAAGGDAGSPTEALLYPRAGLPPASVSLGTADPAVVRVRPASLSLAAPTFFLGGFGGDLTLTAGRAGTTELAVSIEGAASQTFPVTVEAVRAQLSAVAVAKMIGFVMFSFDLAQPLRWNSTAGAELISEDPDSALLSRNGPLSASVTVPNVFLTASQTGVTVHSEEPGRMARFRARIPGLEDAVLEIPVEAPHYSASRALRVEVGVRSNSPIFVGRNVNGFVSQMRPAQPLRFRVSSLNPETAVAEQDVVTVNTGDFGSTVPVRGIALGEATFVVESLDGLIPVPGGDRFTVQVLPATPPRVLTLNTSGVVGKDLQTLAFVSISASVSPAITVTSGDPGKLVLSTSAATAGSASVTLPTSGSREVYLQSVGADSGTVDVTLSAPGLPSTTQSIRLTPSMMVLSRSGDFEVLPPYAPVGLRAAFVPAASGYYFGLPEFSNRTTGEISSITFQGLRPGIAPPAFTVTNSNPAVGTLTQAGQQFTFTPVAPGLTEIELKTAGQPAGRGQLLRVRVNQAALSSTWFNYPLGRNIARPVRITPTGPPTRIRITSSDPSKVLINGLGQAEVDSSETVFVEGLSDSGTARVTADAPGFSGTSFQVDLAPAVLVLETGGGRILESIIQSGSPPTLRARVTSLGPGLAARQDVLRDGAPPVTFQVRSSNASVAPSPGEFTITGEATTIPLRPLGPGNTMFEASAPEGYDRVAEMRSIEARFRYPNLRLPDVLLFRNFQTQVRIEAETGGLPAVVTVTSSNPATAGLALGLQTNPSLPAGPPQQSIVVRDRGEFLIQSVGGEGDLTIDARADNYTSVQARVRVTSPLFGFDGDPRRSTQLVQRELSLPVRVFGPADGFSDSRVQVSSQYRADAPPISLRLESEDPSVAVAEPEVISFPSATGFRVRLLKTGVTTLRVIPPDGFRTDPARGVLQLAVEAAPMRLVAAQVLGKDLTRPGRIEVNGIAPRYKVTSGDPSRVTVSSSPNDPGGESVEVSGFNFYTHALTDNGVVELLAEAEGYAPAVTEVRLGPSGVLLDVSMADVLAGSPPFVAEIRPATLDPVNLSVADREVTIRPGVSIPVYVTSTDARVLAAQGSPVLLNSLTPRAAVRVNPVGAGTATLAAEGPPSFTKPRTGSQATLTVRTPGFNSRPLTAGAWLDGPLVIQTDAPAPPGGLNVRLESDNPAITFTLPIVVPAGQRTASTRVLARADTGTANITLTAPGYQTGIVRLTIVPTGLLFVNSQLSIQVGQRQNGILKPVPLDPATRGVIEPQSDYLFIAGAPNLSSFRLASADPAIARPVAETFTVPTGVSTFLAAFDGRAPGETTIQLNPPAPFQRPSSGGVITVNVR